MIVLKVSKKLLLLIQWYIIIEIKLIQYWINKFKSRI